MPCVGVLLPSAEALAGAQCRDVELPRCEALRDRDVGACEARAVALSHAVTRLEARARHWQAEALRPVPPVTRVVERPVGVPAWVAWGALAVGAALGGWSAWQLAR